MGAKLTDRLRIVEAANPVTYMCWDAPLFLIQHGTMDQVVPVQQSIEFVAKLKPILGEDRVVLEVIEVAEHGDAKSESPENIFPGACFSGFSLEINNHLSIGLSEGAIL